MSDENAANPTPEVPEKPKRAERASDVMMLKNYTPKEPVDGAKMHELGYLPKGQVVSMPEKLANTLTKKGVVSRDAAVE